MHRLLFAKCLNKEILHFMYSTILSVDQLNTILNKPELIIFDCRHELADVTAGQNAYEASHIKGALFAHLDDDLSGPIIPGETGRHPLPSIEKMVERFSQWGIKEGKQVVVYDDKRGAIAARLWWMLRFAGHEHVAVLDGGLQAWIKAGFICENTTKQPTPSVFQPNFKSNWVLDAAAVGALEHVNDWAIVDSRGAERYRGEKEPIDPIAGHIPGAISRPFAENWTDAGLMKTPDLLKARFADLPDPEHCVFYCGSGVTACHNILAFAHAGLAIPRLYPGSWSDWITDARRKIS